VSWGRDFPIVIRTLHNESEAPASQRSQQARAKRNWCPEEGGWGEGRAGGCQADPLGHGMVLCSSRLSPAQIRRRFGPANTTDTVLEPTTPEVEKHVKIPRTWGYPEHSLPSTQGQRRRKHMWEKSVCQMENSKNGRDFFFFLLANKGR